MATSSMDMDSVNTLMYSSQVISAPFYEKPRPKLFEISLAPQSLGTYSQPGQIVALPASHEGAYAAHLTGLVNKVISFCNLPSDWDGYDGVPAPRHIVQDAIQFLNGLPRSAPLPTPMLSGDGEVAFYWEQEDLYLEATLDGGGVYHYFADFHGRYVGEDDLVLGENGLSDLLIEKLNSFIS